MECPTYIYNIISSYSIMAIVLKTDYSTNLTLPVIYIDSINSESPLIEMHGICLRYIRESIEKTREESKIKKVLKNEIISIVPETGGIQQYIVKNIDDIYKRNDGFWVVEDSKNQTVSLFTKTLSKGYLYNSSVVEKIFTLTATKCPKVVPQIPKKATLFESFSSELANRVSLYSQQRQKTENSI